MFRLVEGRTDAAALLWQETRLESSDGEIIGSVAASTLLSVWIDITNTHDRLYHSEAAVNCSLQCYDGGNGVYKHLHLVIAISAAMRACTRACLFIKNGQFTCNCAYVCADMSTGVEL